MVPRALGQHVGVDSCMDTGSGLSRQSQRLGGTFRHPVEKKILNFIQENIEIVVQTVFLF